MNSSQQNQPFTEEEQKLMSKTATPAQKTTERPKSNGATSFPQRKAEAPVQATEGLVKARRELEKSDRSERSKQDSLVVQQAIEDAVREETLYTTAKSQTLKILRSQEFEGVVVEELDNDDIAIEPDQQVNAAIADFFGGTKLSGLLASTTIAGLPSAS